ncbi:hypothetical protein [Bradyrhizobium sp. Cp5.3]|uniref:hypothetical protein n=1 Tax=Bradyrhizobium sp. Cp5.3 TaxID=443598 RepID=UPI000403158C|nr:hypothetical protein [Bradyrhizobium sp. Cp5.3]
MPLPAEAVSTYIFAKDGNRPFLMRRVFSEDIALEMVVKTDAISFPDTAIGLNAVEDILVRRFSVEYENIYTFCLSQPSETDRARFQCHWLVGMSARVTGRPLRVGCGRYDWHFNDDGKVVRLVITIEVMKILSGAELDGVMRWLSSLPYPWCSPAQALMSFPALQDLSAVEAYLKQAQ